jgi:iron complex transport system substrate-binding protein
VGQITGGEVTIISLQTTSLASFWHDLCRVASILGVTKNGVQLVAALQTRMRRIEAKTMPLKSRPTVVCLEWADPLMAAGYWMPELVRMAGGDALLAEPGKHSPPITSGDLRRADPEVLVIAPCGFDLSRGREDLPVLASRPDWEDLTAVRQGRVYLADGNQYFNRPGPRLVDSLEILAEILHPELFEFGHQGTAWEPCHARTGSTGEDRAG